MTKKEFLDWEIKRVPTKTCTLIFYRFDPQLHYKLPLLTSHIAAGFPSPADDYIENKLDLNAYLIKHPAATFFVRVEGDSMINAGINSGDILVVDRAAECTHNAIVVAMLNGEFTIKRIEKQNDKVFLVPENNEYDPIEITPEMDFEIWGVVTYAIHSVK